MGYRFEDLRDEYQSNFGNCKIEAERESELDEIIAKIEENRSRYQKLEERLGIPWYFLGVIHERESSGTLTPICIMAIP